MLVYTCCLQVNLVVAQLFSMEKACSAKALDQL